MAGLIERALRFLALRFAPVDRPTRVLSRSATGGVYVDHDTALTYTAVWSAVHIIAQSVGMLPWHVFEALPGGGTRMRDDLPLDWMLYGQPNPEMTAQTFREVLTAHCAMWGNGYAEIVPNAAGRPAAMYPLPPDRVAPIRLGEAFDYGDGIAPAGSLAYMVRQDTRAPVVLPPSRVLHIRGLGFDGLVGYDVVSYMSGSIGTGLAAERFSAAFFANGSHLSGGLFHPKKLSADARANLRAAWSEAYSGGPTKAFRMAVFDEGVEWKQFSVHPEAAQLIETRKFQTQDVARFFRIPPHMMALLERATFANIEQQAIDFATHTILPWVTRWEQEANVKLLGRALGVRGYTRLNMRALLRGDLKSRYEAYQIGRQWGWLSANDIRELEEMNPIPGIAGEAYIVQTSYMDADRLDEEPATPARPAPGAPPGAPPAEPAEPGSGAEDAAAALAPVVDDAVRRILSREGHALGKKLARASRSAWSAEIRDWLSGQREYVHDALRPAMLAAGIHDPEPVLLDLWEMYVLAVDAQWSDGQADTLARAPGMTAAVRRAMLFALTEGRGDAVPVQKDR